MKNSKVLIVEDELLIAESIRLLLMEREITVVGIAISYDEAISLLKQHQPDLILLDIRLYGGKSGIDLAEKISKLKENIPYIILSSQNDSKTIENTMFVTDAAGFLTKPIDKEILWDTVERALNKN